MQKIADAVNSKVLCVNLPRNVCCKILYRNVSSAREDKQNLLLIQDFYKCLLIIVLKLSHYNVIRWTDFCLRQEILQADMFVCWFVT